MQYGNGVRLKFEYQDGAHRRPTLQRLETPSGGIRYTRYMRYDGEGRVLQTGNVSNAGLFRYDVSQYEYDAVNRLSQAKTTWVWGAPITDERYTHDGLGNLRSLVDLTGENEFSVSVSPIDRDRVCRFSRPTATTTSSWEGLVFDVTKSKRTGPGCNYRYDARGNVAGIDDKTRRKFAYDHHSRLTNIDRGDAELAMGYGPLGDVARVSTKGASVDEAREDRRYGPFVETSMFAAESTSTRLIERRIPGPLGIVMARRGWLAPNIQYWHPEPDGNGVFTDEAGNVLQDQLYRPFGDVRQEMGTPNGKDYTRYQFEGADRLRGFGIVHMGARSYDPVSGRFLQRDPLGLDRSATRSNPYSYAWNDPINRSDPSGLDPAVECKDGSCPNGVEGALILGAVHGAIALRRLFGRGSGGKGGGARTHRPAALASKPRSSTTTSRPQHHHGSDEAPESAWPRSCSDALREEAAQTRRRLPNDRGPRRHRSGWLHHRRIGQTSPHSRRPSDQDERTRSRKRLLVRPDRLSDSRRRRPPVPLRRCAVARAAIARKGVQKMDNLLVIGGDDVDDLIAATRKFAAAKPGYQVVAMHGNGTTFQVLHNGTKVPVSTRAVAKLIKKHAAGGKTHLARVVPGSGLFRWTCAAACQSPWSLRNSPHHQRSRATRASRSTGERQVGADRAVATLASTRASFRVASVTSRSRVSPPVQRQEMRAALEQRQCARPAATPAFDRSGPS